MFSLGYCHLKGAIEHHVRRPPGVKTKIEHQDQDLLILPETGPTTDHHWTFPIATDHCGTLPIASTTSFAKIELVASRSAIELVAIVFEICYLTG